MGFDTTPVRPLAKIYTLAMIIQDVTQYLKKESQAELNPDFLATLANRVIMDTAEFLSGAGSDDYGKLVNINDEASSVSTVIVIGASYTNATRTINKTAHGLTAADVGKRIGYFSDVGISEGATPAPRMGIAEIESITSANAFVITKAAGADISSLQYAVYSAHSATTVDISGYRISSIVKLKDSINGEIIKSGDIQFDNLSRFPEKQAKIFWYKHGQYLFFYIGTEVVTVGTWTLSYNSYPQLFTDQDSLVDIRDDYVPLVIAQLKNLTREHLEMGVSDELNTIIDQKKKEIRENIRREKMAIDEKNQKKSVN